MNTYQCRRATKKTTPTPNAEDAKTHISRLRACVRQQTISPLDRTPHSPLTQPSTHPPINQPTTCPSISLPTRPASPTACPPTLEPLPTYPGAPAHLPWSPWQSVRQRPLTTSTSASASPPRTCPRAAGKGNGRTQLQGCRGVNRVRRHRMNAWLDVTTGFVRFHRCVRVLEAWHFTA